MDAPSKPLFTRMTLTPEPSLEGLSKPETSAKKCMKNESCKSTSMYNMCKPMRIRVKACRKIPWIAMALQIKTRLWLGGVVGDASRIGISPMPCSIWLSSVACLCKNCSL